MIHRRLQRQVSSGVGAENIPTAGRVRVNILVEFFSEYEFIRGTREQTTARRRLATRGRLNWDVIEIRDCKS